MKKYYEDFSRLPVSRMAKKISEMTFEYENTDVPEKHYKAILEQEVISMIASDSTMHLILLGAVIKQLEALRNESEELFVKALICMDKKIKVDNIDNRILKSLNNTTSDIATRKLLNSDILDYYDFNYEKQKKKDLENQTGF